MIFWQIFLVFFELGLVAFGGSAPQLPLLQSIVVDQNHWISSAQFLQAFVISQVVPGPNMSIGTVIGYWTAGLGGWIAAFAGIYLAPLLIMRVASYFFERHKNFAVVKRVELAFRPVVVGLFATTVVKIFLEQACGYEFLALLLAIPVLWLYINKKISSITAVFLSGAVWWILLQLATITPNQ